MKLFPKRKESFLKLRVYQGPSQTTKTILKPHQILNNIHFQHVGWSRLRTFTSFTWEPLLIIPATDLFVLGGGVVRDCIFEMKGDRQ